MEIILLIGGALALIGILGGGSGSGDNSPGHDQGSSRGSDKSYYYPSSSRETGESYDTYENRKRLYRESRDYIDAQIEARDRERRDW